MSVLATPDHVIAPAHCTRAETNALSHPRILNRDEVPVSRRQRVRPMAARPGGLLMDAWTPFWECSSLTRSYPAVVGGWSGQSAA